MDVIFKNRSKMKRYLEQEVGIISYDEFKKWLAYLVESAEIINEGEDVNQNIVVCEDLIFEGVNNDFIIAVNFVKTIHRDEIIYVVDLNYEKEIIKC